MADWRPVIIMQFHKVSLYVSVEQLQNTVRITLSVISVSLVKQKTYSSFFIYSGSPTTDAISNLFL